MTKPHKHIRWTSLEIKRLTQLVHEGKANRQIAEILERSLNSIVGQRRRLRLITKPHKLNHRDPKLIAQVIKFRMAGWQSKEVAEIFGVKRHSIAKITQRAGLSKRLPFKRPFKKQWLQWTDIEMARLRKLCGHFHMLGFKEEHHTQIARHFPNRTRSAVRQRANAMMRYWITPEQIRERQRARKKQLRVY